MQQPNSTQHTAAICQPLSTQGGESYSHWHCPNWRAASLEGPGLQRSALCSGECLSTPQWLLNENVLVCGRPPAFCDVLLLTSFLHLIVYFSDVKVKFVENAVKRIQPLPAGNESWDMLDHEESTWCILCYQKRKEAFVVCNSTSLQNGTALWCHDNAISLQMHPLKDEAPQLGHSCSVHPHSSTQGKIWSPLIQI